MRDISKKIYINDKYYLIKNNWHYICVRIKKKLMKKCIEIFDLRYIY